MSGTAPPPQPSRVIGATIASVLLPGSGHLLLGRLPPGLLILGGTAAGATAGAWHLVAGIELFESSLGAFLFGVLLRGLLLLHGFAVLDCYLRSVQPVGSSGDPAGEQMRLAVLLNLLVPGTGYLLARYWIRAATGLALLVLVLFFARVGSNRLIDLIYVGLQALMAAAVFRQMAVEVSRAEAEGRAPPPRVTHVPAAQIVVLVSLVAATGGLGALIYHGMPDSTVFQLDGREISASRSKEGITFTVPRLGLTLNARGAGWRVSQSTGFLFAADHGGQGALMMGIQPIPPFVREGRYLVRLRRWLEGQGLVHQRTLPLDLNGVPAVQMRFSGDYQGRAAIDHWAVAVPRRSYALLLMLYCERSHCAQLAPLLELTRDSLTLTAP